MKLKLVAMVRGSGCRHARLRATLGIDSDDLSGSGRDGETRKPGISPGGVNGIGVDSDSFYVLLISSMHLDSSAPCKRSGKMRACVVVVAALWPRNLRNDFTNGTCARHFLIESFASH